VTRYQRVLVVVLLVAVLTVLHYSTAPHLPALHILYRELYLVPIFLAGRWLGLRGGLATSLVITALYLPHMVVRWGSASARDFLNLFGGEGHINPVDLGNLFELVIFNVFGALVGRYTDIQRKYATAIRRAEAPAAPLPAHGRNLLLYLDESQASLRAAKYVADIFGGTGVGVTMLAVYQEPRADFFGSEAELSRFRQEKRAALGHALGEARRILLAAGFGEGDLTLKEVVSQGGQLSNEILREQQAGAYDTVILGREPLSKAEEFLVGSAATRLVREGQGGVLVVNPSGPSGLP
jgi:nucleotide-binding universal stress UspA family protein